MTRPPPRRRGQMIPIVSMILIVFSFIGLAYMTQSRAVTSVTGITMYGAKAHQLALAVSEEVLLAIDQQFDEANGAPWKAEILAAVAGQEDGAEIEVAPDIGGFLSTSERLINATGDADLVLAQLRFHGFHRLHYHGNDAFSAPEAFYWEEALDGNDEAARAPPHDWVGFATVQVRVSVRGVERQVQISRDIKLVDVRPPAREFAFFNWSGLTQEQADAGLGNYSLNRGGEMAIWPQGHGRVLIRGPFLLVTDGQQECAGGKRRGGGMGRNFTWPAGGSSWNDMSVLPPRRAAVYDALGAPWAKNMRPKKRGKTVALFNRIPFMKTVGFPPGIWGLADMVPTPYFCGSGNETAQTFSVMGSPGRPPSGIGDENLGDGWSMFRGLHVNLSDGGSIFGEHAAGSNLPGIGEQQGITIEGGGLLNLFRLARFDPGPNVGMCVAISLPVPPSVCTNAFTMLPCYIPTPGCMGLHYNAKMAAPDPIDPQNWSGQVSDGFAMAPFAIQKWDKEHVPLLKSLMGFALQYAMAYAFGSVGSNGMGEAFSGGASFTENLMGSLTGNIEGSFLKSISWGTVVKTVGRQMSQSVLNNMLTQQRLDASGLASPTAAEIAQAVPEGLWPRDFRRAYMRGATRMHLDFEDALGDDDRMNLDGIIMIERFPDEPVSFDYTGKGIIYSLTDGETNLNPQLGEIAPVSSGTGAATDDWLTFVHVRAGQADETGGDAQVDLGSNRLELSLHAEEGVTVSNESATLFGNYTCLTPNKYRIESGSRFDVFYNHELLSPQEHGGQGPDTQWEADDPTWKRASISPKVSGYYDRFK